MNGDPTAVPSFVHLDSHFAAELFKTFKEVREEDYELYRRSDLREIASEWSRQLKGSDSSPFTLLSAVSIKMKLINEAYDRYITSFSI